MRPLYSLLAIVGSICLIVGGLLVPELASMKYEATRDSLNKGIPEVNPERPVFAFKVDVNCFDENGVNRCPLNRNYELPIDIDGDGDYDMRDYRLHLDLITNVEEWHPDGWIKCLEKPMEWHWTRPLECYTNCVMDFELNATVCLNDKPGPEVFIQEKAYLLYPQAIQWMTGAR